jgi:hypothetical protein
MFSETNANLLIKFQWRLLCVQVDWKDQSKFSRYKLIDVLLFILDDDQSMAYLNDWDKKIPNLDVVDDYRSERKQIQTYRGNSVPFSFGDVSDINF